MRILPVFDGYTEECPRIEVDTPVRGSKVPVILNEIGFIKGWPENIVVDNGRKSSSGNALDRWAYGRGEKLHFISPWRTIENAYVESFNVRLRDQYLNRIGF